MSHLLIESHFLPSIEYFAVLQRYDDIQFEAHEHFEKQGYRNRCFILTVQGAQRLTVPVAGRHGKVLITDVEIESGVRWQANMWRTIESAYANSPFFEHYRDDLHGVLYSGERYLFNLNVKILSLCLKWLRMTKTISTSVSYEAEAGRDDLRNVILAKAPFTSRAFLRPVPYQQVFGKTFVPNMSILDLLCCVGPEAGRVLAASASMK